MTYIRSTTIIQGYKQDISKVTLQMQFFEMKRNNTCLWKHVSMKLLEVSLFFASVVSSANTVTVIGYNAITGHNYEQPIFQLKHHIYTKYDHV